MRGILARLGVMTIVVFAVLGVTDRASADPGWNNGVPGGVADLVVNGDLLSHQWVVRDEKLSGLLCSVQEGGVTPGTHRVIRFSVQTPNIGNGPIDLGDPNAHVAANDGLYEFATCHNHFHFKHYTLYELIDPATGHVWKTAKHGFCMIDTNPAPPSVGNNVPTGPRVYDRCGRVGIPGNQGISVGWADEYIFRLGGQYFVLDGGDGQPVVPPGTYLLRITVNPAYDPDASGNCPPIAHKDPNGKCHQLPESNYFNNTAETLINIPDHPGKGDQNGPLANGKGVIDVTSEDLDGD